MQLLHPFINSLRTTWTLLFTTLCIANLCLAETSDKQVVLFIGDSLTDGYEISSTDAYPALLAAKWKAEGRNIEVINGSVSGSTTSSALPRLRWVESKKPDIVVLALGANDGLRGIDLEISRTNLQQAIEWARERSIRVVLAGMLLPPNYGTEYRNQFEAMFVALAQRDGVTLIPFLLEGVATIPEMNLADGIHPNEQGHRRMMQTVAKYLEPLLF
jgi:acyl-CoA thioesterase-1